MLTKVLVLGHWEKKMSFHATMAYKPINISTGLEPVLSQTENLCIASYYRQY